MGGIFGAALAARGVRSVDAFNILTADAAWAVKARSRAARDGVMLAAYTRGRRERGRCRGRAVDGRGERRRAAWIAALAAAGAFAGAAADAGWRDLADRIAREKTRG